MSKTEATPRPWEVSKKFPTHVYHWKDKNTFRVACECDVHGQGEGSANAELIVKAVNNYDRLVEALDFMVKYTKDVYDPIDYPNRLPEIESLLKELKP